MNNKSISNGNPCKFKFSFKNLHKMFGLTTNQLHILLSEKRIEKNKVLLSEKTLSKGAYYRMKDQAITNITKSMMLISLLLSCDIISYDDMISIITTSSRLIEEDIPPNEIYDRIKDFLKRML